MSIIAGTAVLLVLTFSAIALPGVHQGGEGVAPGTASVSWPKLEPGEVAIEYIAHACFRVRSSKGTTILIDPYASRVWLGYDFPDGITADAILVSHPHFDHDAGVFMGRPFPWPDVRVVREPGEHAADDIRIHGVRGKHAGPYGKEFGQINTMWVVEVDDLRIVHLGDNEPLSEAKVAELGRVDILMITIDGEEHLLTFDEVRDMRAALRPRILVPMHYRHTDLEPKEGSPKDLGPIDPWLAGQQNVQRLDRHIAVFSQATLPDEQRVVVFPHSPVVQPPQ